MIESYYKIKLSNILIFVYILCIMGFYTLRDTTFLGDNIKYLMILGIAIAIVKILFFWKAKVIPDLIIIFFVYIITAYFYLHNPDTRLIIAVLTMGCLWDKDIDKVIDYFFGAKLIFYLIGLIGGGYSHINGVALHGGMVILLYMCRKDGKLKWNNIVIIFMSFFILCIYTDSGSAKIAMIYVAISLISIKFNILKFLYKNKSIIFIYPILLFINYYFSMCIGEDSMPFIGEFLSKRTNDIFLSFIYDLDNATSSRLTLANFSIKYFGISLMGGNIDYSKLRIGYGQYFNLDSGFIWMLQAWGGLLSIIFLLMTIFLMSYLLKKQKYNYIVAAIVISLWGVNEDMLLSVGTNFLIPFIIHALLYYANFEYNIYNYKKEQIT